MAAKEHQMTPDHSPFTVRVEKAETALAAVMTNMRIWLDNHQVEPVEFKIAMTGVPAGIAFDIRFRSENEASLFQQAFAHPSS
jgi:hypothetical protein